MVENLEHGALDSPDDPESYGLAIEEKAQALEGSTVYGASLPAGEAGDKFLDDRPAVARKNGLAVKKPALTGRNGSTCEPAEQAGGP